MERNKNQSKNQSNKNKNKNKTLQKKNQIVKKGEYRTTVMSFGIPSIALLTELMPFWYWTIYFLAGRTSGHPVFTAKL